MTRGSLRKCIWIYRLSCLGLFGLFTSHIFNARFVENDKWIIVRGTVVGVRTVTEFFDNPYGPTTYLERKAVSVSFDLGDAVCTGVVRGAGFHYHDGQRVRLFVDPANPGMVSLSRPYHREGSFLALLGIVTVMCLQAFGEMLFRRSA